MNRIDKIISESIDKFILREIDEVLKNPAEAWANMEGGTYKQKRGRYNVQPRKKITSLSEATTINQVGRLLRSEWYSKELGAIGGFARNYALYGNAAADALFNFFRDEKGDMFVQFNQLYEKVNSYTKNIEDWSKYGEEGPVLSRLKDLVPFLEELATYIGFLANKTKDLMKYPPFLQLRGNAARKGNIIDGYSTVNGLLDTVLNPKKKVEANKVTTKIRRCVDYINDFIRMREQQQIRF